MGKRAFARAPKENLEPAEVERQPEPTEPPVRLRVRNRLIAPVAGVKPGATGEVSREAFLKTPWAFVVIS